MIVRMNHPDNHPGDSSGTVNPRHSSSPSMQASTPVPFIRTLQHGTPTARTDGNLAVGVVGEKPHSHRENRCLGYRPARRVRFRSCVIPFDWYRALSRFQASGSCQVEGAPDHFRTRNRPIASGYGQEEVHPDHNRTLTGWIPSENGQNRRSTDRNRTRIVRHRDQSSSQPLRRRRRSYVRRPSESRRRPACRSTAAVGRRHRIQCELSCSRPMRIVCARARSADSPRLGLFYAPSL